MRGGSISQSVCGGKSIGPRVIIIAEIDSMEVALDVRKKIDEKCFFIKEKFYFEKKIYLLFFFDKNSFFWEILKFLRKKLKNHEKSAIFSLFFSQKKNMDFS